MWWRWSVWNVRAMTATIASAPMDVAVPESHLDLLTRPIVGVFTTMPPDGQPQSSLVWVDHDGECARVNTTLERREGRDLLVDPGPRCSSWIPVPRAGSSRSAATRRS